MSVSKMPDGRWKVTCRYTTFDGTRKQKKKEGFPTKREAQQFEKDFLQKMNGSLSMSMSSLFDLYLEDAKARLKPATYNNLMIITENYLRPFFGEIPVQDVTPLIVRNWFAHLQTAVSPKTKRPIAPSSATLVKTKLSSVFNFAVKYYGLKSNPCANVSAPRKTAKREMRFLTVQEFKKFRECEKNDLYRLAFDTLFWTGMREGEMLALTPGDIADGEININKTYFKLRGEEIIGTPKTASSVRKISIPAFLQDELAPLVRATEPDARIFEGVIACTLREHCTRNCAKANVPAIRVHDLRHSHASMLIDRGVQPLLVSERLGHENVTITLSVYSHLYKAKRDDLTAILEKCYESDTQ